MLTLDVPTSFFELDTYIQSVAKVTKKFEVQATTLRYKKRPLFSTLIGQTVRLTSISKLLVPIITTKFFVPGAVNLFLKSRG